MDALEKETQLNDLKSELAAVQQKIQKLQGVKDITDRVASAFPLGRVGGSGRNTLKVLFLVPDKNRHRTVNDFIKK